MAESYNVHMGLAESVEIAVIAALISSPGRVRRIETDRQELVLGALPLYVLKGLGMSAGTLERLGWLGIEQVGQLKAWKKPQVTAYFGPEGKGLLPYLFGPYRTQLGRYTSAPRLSAQLEFGDPVSEPGELQQAVARLELQLSVKLENYAASRFTVVALSHGLELKATRIAKAPLPHAGEIINLALLALEDTHAQPLGIDALTLELSGLSRPAK